MRSQKPFSLHGQGTRNRIVSQDKSTEQQKQQNASKELKYSLFWAVSITSTPVCPSPVPRERTFEQARICQRQIPWHLSTDENIAAYGRAQRQSTPYSECKGKSDTRCVCNDSPISIGCLEISDLSITRKYVHIILSNREDLYPGK